MKQKLCAFLLFRVFGWSFQGEIPTEKKYVFISGPHTSNWDFIYGGLATQALGLKVSILVKDDYFVWPIRSICHWLGLVPVTRDNSTNFVEAMAKEFIGRDHFVPFIAPEGTRSYRETLKSGYYYLAKAADVPIVIGGPNYATKSIVMLPARKTMASFEEDQNNVIEFLRVMEGRRPQNSFSS